MLQQTRFTPLFTGRAEVSATASLVPPPVRVFTGRDAIVQVQARLAALANTTGQTGEVDSLAYFLSTPHGTKKIPHLILFGDSTRLSGAVLLFEYRTPLGGSRVFATSDSTGRRDVIAPSGFRARIAAAAARFLIEQGAHIVHAAFSERHVACDRHRDPTNGHPLFHDTPAINVRHTIATELKAHRPGGVRGDWAVREREIPAYLPLLFSLETTLSRIGSKTRFNLRYYRRRCESHLGSHFVAQPQLTLAEFLAFSRKCTYAASDELATFRFEAMQSEPNQVMRGVRDDSGNWLSLVGTRRHNGFVELDWQMNRDDLPAYSLATVMRSYLMEYEIAQGSTRLYIEGGTPQFIAGSFLRQQVGELTVVRDSMYAAMLERFARKVFPPKNYIGQILQDPMLEWNSW